MGNDKDKIWKISRILVPIFLALLVAVYAYGQLNGRFEAIEKEVVKAEDTRERLIRVEEGVEYLKKGVDDIKKELKDARRNTRTTE